MTTMDSSPNNNSNSITTTSSSSSTTKPGNGGKRGGWGPLRLIPRVPLPGIPVPRLPLPGIPGLRRGPSSSNARIAAGTATATTAGTAASLTLSSSDASMAASAASSATASSSSTSALAAPAKAKPQLKPATDVLAGALARALSQSTIHPLDTLKVRLQTRPPPSAAAAAASAAAAAAPTVRGLSKFGQLVPPAGASGYGANLQAMTAGLASLYKGVLGAASGAGIAIGAYFACYGFACNLLTAHTDLSPSAAAFVAGGAAAAGSSVVKVPLAVCIRSVQAGVYPNVFAAASSITAQAGPRGLFTGFFPTLLEDVPDMAVKFAAYESMRQLHRSMNEGRAASPQEDFAMGALAGALAAGATTPLDVIKTRMMCAAASRPTMMGAAREVLAASGPKGFLAGIGARALSNGINSAVFFCFFEAIRTSLQQNPPTALSAGAAWNNAGRAMAAWAAQARERAAGIPRAVSSLPLLVPLLPHGALRHGSNDDSSDGSLSHHLGWATAGIGGGMEWLNAARSSGQQQLSLALPAVAGYGGGGGAEQQLMLLADAGVLHAGDTGHLVDSPLGGVGGFFRGGDGYYRRAGAGAGCGDDSSRSGFSLSLLARASPLRLEHHSQIAMAMAALKGGVEGGSCIPLDEE